MSRGNTICRLLSKTFTQKFNPALGRFSAENEITCLVFSTSLQSEEDVEGISDLMNRLPGILEWSVDLDDWEKVLRIECKEISSEQIIRALTDKGVSVEVMPV